MNFVQGARDGKAFRSGALRFDLPDILNATCPEKVTLGLRPEQISIGTIGNGKVGFDLNVDVVEPIGNELLVYGRVGEQELIVRCDPRTEVRTDSRLPVYFDPMAVHYFDTSSEESLVRD